MTFNLGTYQNRLEAYPLDAISLDGKRGPCSTADHAVSDMPSSSCRSSRRSLWVLQGLFVAMTLGLLAYLNFVRRMEDNFDSLPWRRWPLDEAGEEREAWSRLG